MNKSQLENQLRGVLKKLEASSESIIKTRGYTREVAKIRLLEELIKEQLQNENSRIPAR